MEEIIVMNMNASADMRGYGREWQKTGKFFLKRHPWCVRCKAKGRLVSATVVGHVQPYRGDSKLFRDEKNGSPFSRAAMIIRR